MHILVAKTNCDVCGLIVQTYSFLSGPVSHLDENFPMGEIEVPYAHRFTMIEAPQSFSTNLEHISV